MASKKKEDVKKPGFAERFANAYAKSAKTEHPEDKNEKKFKPGEGVVEVVDADDKHFA